MFMICAFISRSNDRRKITNRIDCFKRLFLMTRQSPLKYKNIRLDSLFIEVDNARLNGRVISFYSTASNTIPSVISEDWLIMKHAYLQNCVYCVYCIYTEEGDRGR